MRLLRKKKKKKKKKTETKSHKHQKYAPNESSADLS